MKKQPGNLEGDPPQLLAALRNEDYCYLTTTGRVTGKLHEIEIWFGIQNDTLYLLSGDRDKPDWVKNLLKNPLVTVRIADHIFKGTARRINTDEEDLMARKLLDGKYQQWREGRRFSKWARTALVVGIDLNDPGKEQA